MKKTIVSLVVVLVVGLLASQAFAWRGAGNNGYGYHNRGVTQQNWHYRQGKGYYPQRHAKQWQNCFRFSFNYPCYGGRQYHYPGYGPRWGRR